MRQAMSGMMRTWASRSLISKAAVEIGWGPVQVVPSLGLLFADQAVYLHAGGRVSLGISWSLRFDLEAQSRIPVHLPDSLNLCHGGARAGLGLRGVLKKGVLGSAHYDLGSGECEASHRVLLGVTFAFGDEPLRRIPTPEEVGVPRLWLGIVDPVLDCNGWMLDESTLLPKFKFGDPDLQDPTLIRRGTDPRLMFMGLLNVFRARAKPDVRRPPPPTRKAPGGLANDSPPPNLGKGQPPPTQTSHLGVDEAQGRGLGDQVGNEGGRVAKNQSARLRRPADRHSALKVKQKTLAKEKNTVIEPGGGRSIKTLTPSTPEIWLAQERPSPSTGEPTACMMGPYIQFRVQASINWIVAHSRRLVFLMNSVLRNGLFLSSA